VPGDPHGLGLGRHYPIHQVDCVLHAEACLDPGEAGIGGDRLQRQGIADRPQVGGPVAEHVADFVAITRLNVAQQAQRMRASRRPEQLWRHRGRAGRPR